MTFNADEYVRIGRHTVHVRSVEGSGDGRRIEFAEVLGGHGQVIGLVQLGCLNPLGWMWAAGDGWEHTDAPSIQEAVQNVVDAAMRHRFYNARSWDAAMAGMDRYKRAKERARACPTCGK